MTIIRTLPRTPLQGAADWCSFMKLKGKPRQIEPELRRTLVLYGELTQICYDSFYGDRHFSDFGTLFTWNTQY